MSASVLEDVGGQASFGVIGSRGGLLGELWHLGREFFFVESSSSRWCGQEFRYFCEELECHP